MPGAGTPSGLQRGVTLRQLIAPEVTKNSHNISDWAIFFWTSGYGAHSHRLQKMVCFPRQGILQAKPIRNEGNMN
jgi:hypothetical protein